ncbi:UspA [Sphingobium indicum BiD32]|uniref:UspA n=1 Tax=Sphingobium indicum BiD32 TaxID=1301087 RepID=N1MPV6_9SPHN|nr:universal stress protein [Sphingobium indicum]CCW18759.1 UspA [Sphingobium indicum BiD32]
MKTILLHIHEDNAQNSRMEVALDIARATGAHIRCLQVTPVIEFVSADMYGGSYVLPSDIDEIRKAEDKVKAKVEARLQREGVAWDWRHSDGEVVQCLLSASRLADAIVVTLPTPGRRAIGDPLPIVADLAISSRAPILAVPQACQSFACQGRAMVAWDGSHEAAVALCAARPLLALAGEVHVVTVEEKTKRDFPPIDASEYLSRHGIASEIHEWPRKGRTVEEALAAAADELRADWITMGAFGHSRLRETIFGGVTRYLLSEARVPLLLAH